jgi:polyisoprenoid-binding protein YceI
VTSPRTADSRPRRPSLLRNRWFLLAAGILVAAGLVGAWMGVSYLFLREPAPAAVGLSTASPAVASAAPSTSGEASTDPTASDDPSAPTTGEGLDGTWTVDASVGSFSDFSGSFVGYRVDEELANIGAATAVGRTPDVAGTLTFAGTQITAVEIEADLSTLRSDKSQRDGQLRRQALETDQFPTATFMLTQPIELGFVPADGEVVPATATGDLMIHGVTKSIEIPVEARLAGDVVTVTGSIDILFADYDIDRPVSFAVLSIADHGTMEFQLQLTKA